MKRLLASLLIAVTSVTYAHRVEQVKIDGYMPLRIGSKIVLFLTKVYTYNDILPAGTVELYIMTVKCDLNLQRHAITEIYDPITDVSHTMFETSSEIANYMHDQPFTKIDAEFAPITSELCAAMKK